MKNISFSKLFKHIYSNEYLLIKGYYCFLKETLSNDHDRAAAHAFFSICNLFDLSAQSLFDTCCDLKEDNICIETDFGENQQINMFDEKGELVFVLSEYVQCKYLYFYQQNKKYEQEHNCHLDY